MSEIQVAKDIATIAAPLTGAIIETWIKPKLTRLFRSVSTSSKLNEHAFVSKFEEYLTRAYAKHLFLTVLVLQNQRRLLDELYVPLTIRSHDPEVQWRVEGFCGDLFDRFGRILITDTAGMGKSTLSKYLFLRAVDANAGVPILIELRRLSEKRSIVDLLLTELSSISAEFDRDLLYELIRKGNFIFFFDGYDEIASNDREAVTSELQSFIEKAAENRYVLTSRPEAGLAAFSDFQQFSIQPLVKDEAFDLLRKYNPTGETAEPLIAKLQDPAYAGVSEFLKNPFLVSLLYKAYDHKATIPLKKHLFYRQVYDALFESHDLSKPGTFVREKFSNLDIDDFDRVLRLLAFVTMKRGQVEFTKDQLLEILRECKRYFPDLRLKEAAFLKDILVTVPLFVSEGDRYLRWAHRSLQDYFAARFVVEDVKDRRAEIFTRMYESKALERLFNVLDLIYDLDPQSLRRYFLRPFLGTWLEWYQKNYVDEYPGVKRSAVEFRKGYMFLRTCVVTSKQYVDSLNFQEANDKLVRASFIPSGGDLDFTPVGANILFIHSDPKLVVARLLKRRHPDLVQTNLWTERTPDTMRVAQKVVWPGPSRARGVCD